MKKILALFLTLAMLLSFAACGSKPAETTPATEAVQPTAEATQPTTEATQSSEAVVNKCVIYISSLGTILDAFGKSDCIVGAYGSLAEAYNVPSCGKWNEVDVEAVIATGADAVFGYKNYTTEDQIAALNDAGVKTVRSLADIGKALKEVTGW